jgi:hypothetical protein
MVKILVSWTLLQSERERMMILQRENSCLLFIVYYVTSIPNSTRGIVSLLHSEKWRLRECEQTAQVTVCGGIGTPPVLGQSEAVYLSLLPRTA